MFTLLLCSVLSSPIISNNNNPILKWQNSADSDDKGPAPME